MNKEIFSPSSSATQALSVWHYGTVTSCLDVGWMLLKRGRLNVFESVQAASQTAGRGQMRRNWSSPAGNLYVAWRLPYEDIFTTSQAAPALGALLALSLRKMGYPVLVKWPNDLVLIVNGNARKVGGLLLEEREWNLLCGLGINLTSCPNEALLRKDCAMPATTLLGDASKHSSAQTFWQNLVRNAISTYKEEGGFSATWRTQILDLLLWRGSVVELREENRMVRGILEGIGPQGGLLLNTAGRLQEFVSGSVLPATTESV